MAPGGPRCESYLVRLEALTVQGEAILDRAERLTAAEWTGPKGLTLLADQLDWGADVNDFAVPGRRAGLMTAPSPSSAPLTG